MNLNTGYYGVLGNSDANFIEGYNSGKGNLSKKQIEDAHNKGALKPVNNSINLRQTEEKTKKGCFSCFGK